MNPVTTTTTTMIGDHTANSADIALLVVRAVTQNQILHPDTELALTKMKAETLAVVALVTPKITAAMIPTIIMTTGAITVATGTAGRAAPQNQQGLAATETMAAMPAMAAPVMVVYT